MGRKIIDFHSHILPGIDDGSRDVSTTMEMIKATSDMGIDTIIATPHFYANRDTIGKFIARRNNAYKLTRQLIGRQGCEEISHIPEILLGAEVAFFSGISEAEEIGRLCISGTNSMLLEMPFNSWTTENIQEVGRLIYAKNIHIIIAHIERYYSIPDNVKAIDRLLELPVTIQINAGGLTDWSNRKKIMSLLKEGRLPLLGSDCHGVNHRPQNLEKGRNILLKKFGQTMLDRIDRKGNYILYRR